MCLTGDKGTKSVGKLFDTLQEEGGMLSKCLPSGTTPDQVKSLASGRTKMEDSVKWSPAEKTQCLVAFVAAMGKWNDVLEEVGGKWH